MEHAVTCSKNPVNSSGPGTVHIKVFCEVAQEPVIVEKTSQPQRANPKGDSRTVNGRNTAPVTQLRLVASFNPIIYEV